MLYLDSYALSQMEGMTQDLLWLLVKLAGRMSNSNNTCFPSLQTLCEDTGWSKPTVIKYLDQLVVLGLSKKIKRKKENGADTSNLYEVTTTLIGFFQFKPLKAEIMDEETEETPVKSFDTPSKNSLPPRVKSFDTNSRDHINSRNKITKEKKDEKFDAEKYVEDLEIDLELKENLISLVEVRKTKRTPTTKKAIDLMIQKLGTFDKQTQIKMLQNSIMNGWNGVFEIKEEFKKPNYLQGYQRRVDPTQGSCEKIDKVVSVQGNW